MTSKSKYENPEVYNTGYNDGAREERERIVAAIGSLATDSEKKPCPICHGTKRVRCGSTGQDRRGDGSVPVHARGA